MKNIIILSPGNLNVGDNAILFTWLEFLEKEYGKNHYKMERTVYL